MSPFFFLTTTIGEENGDSDSRIISASLGSCRCHRIASKSLGTYGSRSMLKGGLVTQFNLVLNFVCSTKV